MATRQYDLARDGAPHRVAEQAGGAITDAIRITIDLDQVADRDAAALLLETVKIHILQSDWPPA